MYNTTEVKSMQPKSVSIEYFRKDGFSSRSVDGLKHVKILPYLSIVQSVEGTYDVAIESGSMQSTKEGGFFIAPSNAQQTIVHRENPSTKRMICRWLFIDVTINKAYKLDELFAFPPLLNAEATKEMNALFDELFASDDLFDEYSCCYRIVKLLLRFARPAQKKTDEGIQNAAAYLKERYAEKITVRELAKQAKTSESNFYASFKKHFACAPMEYLNGYRLSIAAALLSETDRRINEICYSVGIGDPLYFSRLFKKNYGVSPREYRRTFKNLSSAFKE